MIIAFIIGRIILGLYWIVVGYNHILPSAGTIGYAQSKGIKSAKLAVIASGVLALIGGLSIITGVLTTYGIAALVIFLLVVSFKMHPYWKTTEPMAKMNDKIQFEKNMSLAAAIIMLLAIGSPWMYSL